MREPTFLILTALAAEPLHGYGLIAEVARLSDGRVSLRPGTLYGALDRLVDARLVAVEREEVVDGRLRRYYRLAEQGGDLLAAARDAFTSGVHAVGLVSAVLYAGLAVLAVWAFKQVRNSHGGGGETAAEDRAAGSGSDAAAVTET